ncbi:hypothetical protein L3Q82_001114 [Scortum barcoo]|uniref:Uncharacterized protein n=1 Tax=Scortum barcoo TaxID=214431 RepID=A0ACB8WB03_9TELE|nr:hypothetical protein L3Q82_001114 [Scortum barcoo]
MLRVQQLNLKELRPQRQAGVALKVSAACCAPNQDTDSNPKGVTLNSVCSAGSSLSCRWLDHKFRQHSESSLNLLDMMVTNSGVRHTVAFPDELYSQASNAAIGSHSHKKKNKKLHMYFKRLSRHVLHQMGHSAEAWELIRTQIQTHLMRADLLASSLLNIN